MRYFRGLLLCLLLAILATLLARFIPTLGKVMISLLLGILCRTLWQITPQWRVGIIFCAQNILAMAVVFLGLNLEISSLIKVGPAVLTILVVIVTISIFSSLVLYKFIGLDRETSLLIGIGSGICGSSAIATCSRLVTDDDAKVATSLGIINFVGIIGLSLFPIVAHWRDFSTFESSLLLGGALQSLGHVMAAAGSMGDSVLNQAVMIKMVRVLMILPTVFTLSLVTTKSRQKDRGPWIRQIPLYLWAFIAAVIVANSHLLSPAVIVHGMTLGKGLLLMAMVGVGLGIDLKSFFKQAPKLMFLSLTIQLLQLMIIGLFIWV